MTGSYLGHVENSTIRRTRPIAPHHDPGDRASEVFRRYPGPG